jgi:hypothetical protein
MDKSSRATEKGRSKFKKKVEQPSNSTLTVVLCRERERKKIELFSSYMEFLLISRNVGNNCVKMPDVQTV